MIHGWDRRALGLLLASALGTLGAECPTTYHYMLSTPAALPPPLQGKVYSSGATEIRLPDLKLWLQALDGVAVERMPLPPGAPPLSLMLLFAFQPGNAPWSFQPMSVAVRTDDGRQFAPMAYAGPGAFEPGDHQNGTRGCFANEHHMELLRRTADLRYPIPRESCFVLAFGVRLSGIATLEVGGLAREGQVLSLPPISLVKLPASDVLMTRRPAALEPEAATP